jgi:S1-C subfamily serine protease
LRRGDTIVKINNQAIADAEQLQGLVEKSGVGQDLKLQIQRNNQTIQLTVKTAQMSKDMG